MKTQFIRLIMGALLLMLCNCRISQQASPSFAQIIQFQNLKALNLSEDRLQLSTHNDEILLLLAHYNPKGQLQRDTVFDLLFETAKMSHPLQYDWPLVDNHYLVCTLVEIDNDSSTAAAQLLRDYWAQGQFLKAINRSKIDSLLGHDDYLGMAYWQQGNLEKGEQKIMTFKGLQLFDRFEYQLSILGQ